MTAVGRITRLSRLKDAQILDIFKFSFFCTKLAMRKERSIWGRERLFLKHIHKNEH